MSALRWAREEFVWPGMLFAVALIAALTWYGLTHRTWAGGFVFATGGCMFNRFADRSFESWRKYKREGRVA